MSKALFISESYLKDKTPFYISVDPKDYKSHIETAQDIYIMKILGYKLYNELQDAIIADTVTSDQTELLALIRPCLAWYSYYMALPFVLVKTTNKSLVVKNSDNSNAISFEDMKYLKSSSENTAQSYSEQIVNYLTNPVNYTKFPSYTTPSNYDTRPEKGSQYFNGIYLNDVNRRKNYGDDDENKNITRL